MTMQKDEVSTELGAIIRDLMFRKRITVTAMGEALGIQHATMGRKLRGLTVITVPDLMTIADVLGEDVGELLCACRDSNPKPSHP